MKLGSNWERKVLHERMVSRTLRILHRIWFGKRGKEARLPITLLRGLGNLYETGQAILHDTKSLDGPCPGFKSPAVPLTEHRLVLEGTTMRHNGSRPS